MKVPHKGLDIRAYIGITALTLIAVFTFPQPTSKIVAQEVVATPIPAITPPPPVEKIDHFATLSLTGTGIYVFDTTSQKTLFAKNENISLPLASITKLMTAITALEMERGTTSIMISEQALQTEGDTGLLESELWNLNDLLAYTLVVSSNDGATAIAESFGIEREDFIQEMNKKAQSLTFSQLQFYNETGLDETVEQAGGYGTPKEVSNLLLYAFREHPEVIGLTGEPTISVSSESGFSHVGKNTNILTSSIPSIKAGKTGYSRLAGGNLAIIFTTTNNHEIVVVVLGSNYDDRFTDVEKLVDATIKTVNE